MKNGTRAPVTLDTFREPVAGQIFDNLRKLEKPDAIASALGISVMTIYDWRYRARQRKVPAGLFITFNRRLYLRTDILQEWIASQNPSES